MNRAERFTPTKPGEARETVPACHSAAKTK